MHVLFVQSSLYINIIISGFPAASCSIRRAFSRFVSRNGFATRIMSCHPSHVIHTHSGSRFYQVLSRAGFATSSLLLDLRDACLANLMVTCAAVIRFWGFGSRIDWISERFFGAASPARRTSPSQSNILLWAAMEECTREFPYY